MKRRNNFANFIDPIEIPINSRTQACKSWSLICTIFAINNNNRVQIRFSTIIQNWLTKNHNQKLILLHFLFEPQLVAREMVENGSIMFEADKELR